MRDVAFKISKWKDTRLARALVLRKFFFLVMATISSLGFSLSPVTKVFATSVYDGAVYSTSSLKMRWCPDGSWSNCIGATQPNSSVERSPIWAMRQSCSSYYFDSFRTALKNGNWAIFQEDNAPTGSSEPGAVMFVWTETPTTAQFHGNDSYYGAGHYGLSISGGSTYGDWTPTYSVTVFGTLAGGYHCTANWGNAVGSPVVLSSDYSGPSSYYRLWLSTFAVTYPSGYEGANVPDMAADNDGDGLTAAQEFAQGTSDDSNDTDGDGLSDYTESIWNSNYDNEFCDTSTTPHTCPDSDHAPDPTKKDLFVEIDWINDGTTSFEPSSTQLDLVASKFAAVGIRFHADTGLYGGGKEIVNSEPTVTMSHNALSLNDFYNHKYGNGLESENFDAANRYRIWHYMLFGYNFDDGSSDPDPTTLSGKAEAGGDDAFISYGLLMSEFSSGSARDNAVAGTIVHELGHNLCLSKYTYSGQDSSCVFSDIDNSDSPSTNYLSAMNYQYQKTNTYGYSNGTNGTGDHDDITAINLGIDDFTWHDDDSGVGGPS